MPPLPRTAASVAGSCQIARSISAPAALITAASTGVNRPARIPAPTDRARHAAWKPAAPHFTRGFGTLYLKHVTQADKGCDFDFLEGGAATAEPEIH